MKGKEWSETNFYQLNLHTSSLNSWTNALLVLMANIHHSDKFFIPFTTKYFTERCQILGMQTFVSR